MRLIIVLQLFLLAPLLLTRASQSEANRQNTCETKDPYAKGFLVYNELLLATIKKQMNRLKEACNKKKSKITAKNNCIAKKENLEEDLRNIAEEKKSLKKERQRMERILAMQKKDKETIKESLENPFDCAEIQLLRSKKSGLYKIRPNRTGKYVDVLCDLDEKKNGGAWTVFLNRQVQTTPESFNRPWKDYKEGFGNKSSEFWLGNDILHLLTTSDGTPSTLRVEAENFHGDSRWAEWNIFRVEDEEHNYKLTVKNYQETSTLGDGLLVHDGISFTTFDVDNDNYENNNCANIDNNNPLTGGWWYNVCGNVRPTDKISNNDDYTSAFWEPWVKDAYIVQSLRRISMKFRRLNYRKLASPKKN